MEVEVEADSVDSVVAVEVSAAFSVEVSAAFSAAVVVDSVELGDSVEVVVVVAAAAAVSGFTAFAVRFREVFLAFTFGVVLDGLMFSCDFS